MLLSSDHCPCRLRREQQNLVQKAMRHPLESQERYERQKKRTLKVRAHSSAIPRMYALSAFFPLVIGEREKLGTTAADDGRAINIFVDPSPEVLACAFHVRACARTSCEPRGVAEHILLSYRETT